MSQRHSQSPHSSPPSSPPSSPTSASSQERLILVPDDQFESDALLGLWPDDEEAPVTPTTANIERTSSAASNAPALPPRLIIPLLISPCLKLGTTYIPRAVDLAGPVPALVGLAGMALLSAFTSQVWVLLGRYVSRWTIEEIVAEAIIRNPGRRGSPKDKWKRRVRKGIRGLVCLTALLLCAMYLHESAHLLQAALPFETNHATQAGTTVIFAAFLVPLVAASSLGERKILWSNFLSIVLQFVIAIVGVAHYFHSQDESKHGHAGPKRALPKFTRSHTEAGTWETISILSFAFANQLLALPLYTALATNFAAKPTFAPRPRTRRMITSFPMLLLVSTIISVALTVPLILAPLTKHAAPPDPAAIPTVPFRPPLRETVSRKLEAAIPTIQVFALLLAIPPLFAGVIVPRIRQRAYRWILFFSSVLLAAVIPGRRAGLSGLAMTLSLLTCYVFPALLHAIFHGLRRPRSILFTHSNVPAITSSEPGNSQDPEILLQHKERSLQRRRLARRVLWDIGVWAVLGPVGLAATVWTAGRTVSVMSSLKGGLTDFTYRASTYQIAPVSILSSRSAMKGCPTQDGRVPDPGITLPSGICIQYLRKFLESLRKDESNQTPPLYPQVGSEFDLAPTVMSVTHAAYLPEEEPLNFDTESLPEARDRDELSSCPSTVVASPAASIKLDASPPAKDIVTPLPMGRFAILLMLNAVFPLSFEVIYPFVNAMIVEIGVTNDPERVGFYSGLVESIFSLMGFIMILPCGYLSDRFGRKPVILLGFAGLAVSMTSFGLSKTLAGMIASRCIGGGLGASWAAIKVMTGEMTDRSNQDLAFSLLQMTYRLGQIAGLPLGGLLAHPEQRFSWFRTAFWAEYPYLLPCLVGSAFAIFSVIPGFIYIEETLPSKRRQRKKINKRATSYGSTDSSVSATSTLVDSREQSVCAQEPIDIEGVEKVVKPQPSWRSVMTPAIWSLLFNNALMCFASEMVFSIFPLFAYTPIASGGLGMSEAKIGSEMAVRSIVQVTLMLGYSKLIRKIGKLRIYQLAMVAWIITILCFPVLNWAVRAHSLGAESMLFEGCLFAFYVIWSIGGFCWVASASLVNDVAPSAEALSLTTGISQMTLVFPQAVSPALGNSLFAASVHQDILGGHLVWVVMLAMITTATFGWAHSLTLTTSTHDWRENLNDDDDA
ncbi:MFS general substrate transporter, partial [Rhizoctonia solani]